MSAAHEPPRVTPTATYRVQLHAGFTFDHVREVAPYLAALGVSHVYCSPYFAATPGSTHGYDVIDHNRVNAELGGEEGYRRFVAALEAHGMGHIVDFVPNHTGIEGNVNPRWWAMLRDGPESPAARFFDVEWNTETRQVILPFLGDEPGALIERGELSVGLSVGLGAGGEVELRYFDHRFPIDPNTLPEDLESREEVAIVTFNAGAGSAEHRRRFEELLERQHYLLTYWRAGKARVNYRRFFEIDTLAALRQEEPEVFEETHRWLRAEVEAGRVEGVRIDHPDGLRDPAGYLERLAAWDAGGGRPYVVVEKILEGAETLPEDWATDGTTGYEFMNDLGALLVDPAGEPTLSDLYVEVSGDGRDFEEIAYEARLAIVEERFAGVIERFAGRLHSLEEAVASHDLAAAMSAVLACFPVYRTYHRQTSDDPRAPEIAARAVAEARERRPDLRPEALDALRQLLAAPAAEGEGRALALDGQQLCPAVQAKGVEDTAFYRYARLLSLNEVGGDPAHFGAGVERFHARNALRQRHWPRSMTATATHDHKRGEDVRARLHVLSEVAEEWRHAVSRWRSIAATVRRALRREDAPDGFDEYVFYQSVAGVWPAIEPSEAERREVVERLSGYLVKAAREGARRTSWLEPDEAYETALTRFVEQMLDPSGEAGLAFLEDSAALRGLIARRGAINSLSQVLLRATAPGVPDCYQGTETWDLSLVDPDNRRPVDYEARRALLGEFGPAVDGGLTAEEQTARAAGWLAAWPDGRVKAYVLASALAERRRRPALFIEGGYRPLEVEGERADHLVAFAREREGAVAVALATRLPHGLTEGAAETWRPRWGETTVRLPGDWTDRSLLDRLTGRRYAARSGGVLRANELLDVLPVALLAGE